MSLRDHFLLAYAEVLSEHPKQASLWRITAEYLNTAGDEGRSRLREFILHVALQGTGTTEAEEQDVEIVEDRSMDVEEGKIDSRFQHFAELRETCFDLKLEEEWKTISKIMADRLMRGGDYGIAATMLVQAEDGYGLSRLADKILEVYIRRGERSHVEGVLMHDRRGGVFEAGDVSSSHITERCPRPACSRPEARFLESDRRPSRSRCDLGVHIASCFVVRVPRLSLVQNPGCS